jgi:predicted phage-related endonuclease
MDGDSGKRRSFIGGSDAPVIMAGDEAAVVRLWREKRGELEPKDHSGNLIMQLGSRLSPSIGDGTSAQPGKWSKKSKAGSATP